MSEARKAPKWKLDELAARAGVSPRTVRYYVQRGLLPAPEFRGPDTAYGEEHLARLEAIRALQAKHLPLDEIRDALEAATPDALASLRDAKPEPAPTRDVAPRWRRYELAPGLELHVSEAAAPDAKALADRLRAEAQRHARSKG